MARSIALAESASNGTGSSFTWDGGEGVLHASGTWAGATVTLQYAPAQPQSDITMTPSNTDVVLTESVPNRGFNQIPIGTVRVVVAGGGGTESLTVVMARTK
jgi:hypothetical protein